MVSIFMWYSMIFHAIAGHSQTVEGTDGADVLYGIPRYSMLFQGIQTLEGTGGVNFYMVFHDIACYSKALERPLQAPREFAFIWHSMIFHAIPRRSRAPGHRGS